MLHALKELAEREGLSAEPGFKTKAVRWSLVFNSDGQFLHIADQATGEGKQRKAADIDRCPDLSQGEMVSGGAGCRPFLVDGLDVVVQLGREKIAADRLDFFDSKHAYWVNLLRQAGEVVPELAPIADSLSNADQLASMRSQLAEKKAKATELATIAIARGVAEPPKMILQSDTWRDWWRSFRTSLATARQAPAKSPRKSAAKGAKGKKASAEPPADTPPVPGVIRDPSRMLCLLSGEWITPQPTHPKISGLASVGGHSAGDALASFDKDAFCSYGLEQGANAPVSPQMAAVYTAALNRLVKDDQRCVNLAGSKVVYWFNRTIPLEIDPIQQVRLGAFSSGDEDEGSEPTATAASGANLREQLQAESSALRLHEAFRSGEQPELARATFYALTLSGNAGRVIVRDVMEGRFEELVNNVNLWFQDLAIVSRFGDRTLQSFKFNAVLAAPFRELKDAPAPTATTLWSAALAGSPIPAQIMAATLRRTTIDIVQGESPRHARYGLLKACINRLFRSSGVSGMTHELKPVADDLQQNPAYICGQVMGVLAKIQKTALPDVKAGVIERFYAAAMATPVLVLGRLVRTAEVAHLASIRKDRPGLAGYFQNQLIDVWSRLRDKPPTSLSLEEQTLFALGYYHQLALRKVKLSDGETVDLAVEPASNETAD